MDNKAVSPNEYCSCPKCGAIRVNIGAVVKKTNYEEIYGFCRQCDEEFVLIINKEQRSNVILEV